MLTLELVTMKKIAVLVLFALVNGFATLAKADGIKPDDAANDVKSFRRLNAHHSHGLHLQYQKDDNDTGIDLDDFVWTAPGQSKAAQTISSAALTAGPDSNSSSDGLAGNINMQADDGVNAPSAVPEPGTLILLGTGLLIVVVAMRKRIHLR